VGRVAGMWGSVVVAQCGGCSGVGRSPEEVNVAALPALRREPPIALPRLQGEVVGVCGVQVNGAPRAPGMRVGCVEVWWAPTAKGSYVRG